MYSSESGIAPGKPGVECCLESRLRLPLTLRVRRFTRSLAVAAHLYGRLPEPPPPEPSGSGCPCFLPVALLRHLGLLQEELAASVLVCLLEQRGLFDQIPVSECDFWRDERFLLG